MRNDQYFASILSYLEKVSEVKFSLVVKDSGFDDPAYYDKVYTHPPPPSSLTQKYTYLNNSAENGILEIP